MLCCPASSRLGSVRGAGSGLDASALRSYAHTQRHRSTPRTRARSQPAQKEAPTSSPTPEPCADGVQRPHAAPLQASDLLSELLSGQLIDKCRAVPPVPWGPIELAKVLAAGMAVLLAGAGYPILASSGLMTNPIPQDLSATQAAALHAGRELSLLVATSLLLWSTVSSTQPRSKGLFRLDLEPPWLPVTLAVCVATFPLADPVLSQGWGSVLSQIGGPDLAATAAGSQLATEVRECVSSGAWGALGLHVLASGALGPLWEEVFWRGFFLTSLTKVLPPPACIAMSSTTFALLHLTPAAFPSIWLLAAASDVLYLRSGSLGPPLLLHAAWNTCQVLAVAFLGKEAFV